MTLTDRQQRVLEAIVADYIHTAEPVGSRTISKKYNIGVSSATIRNEMADLEDAKLIHQPHTSAGRVPTDAGYRYYVDHILPCLLTSCEDNSSFLEDWMKTGRANDEATRNELLRLLAKHSTYTTMLFLPESEDDEAPVMALLNLLYLAPGRALMIVVTDDEQVNNEFMDIPLSITEQDVAVVNSLLNHYLRGLPARYWAEPLATFLQNQEGHLARFIMESVNRLGDVLASDQQKRVYLEGALNMLDQPEFQDIEKIRSILAALNREETIPTLVAGSYVSDIDVRIGEENGLPEITDCSLMMSSYRIGKQIGHLGILGPKRMNYIACAQLLNAAVNAIENTFGAQYMLVPERQTDLAPLLHSFAWQLRDIR